MQSWNLLKQIQAHWEELNGFQNEHFCQDYVQESTERNALLVKEVGGEAELLLCIKKDLLDRLSSAELPKDFHLNLLPDLSVVVEELSHFNTFCDRAIKDQEISQLELEVQGEVDKFGVALQWLDQRNEAHLQDEIFRILFDDLRLGGWVSEAEKARYEEAHHIARNFCRQVMDQDLSPKERQKEFRDFFIRPTAEKISIKF